MTHEFSSIAALVIAWVEVMVVTYTAMYALANVTLLLLGFNRVRDQVRGLAFEDLDQMDQAGSVPSVALLVPAYNEAVVIVESVLALTELDYPQVEIVVCNDGSNDATMQQLRQAFGLRRRDVPMRSELRTARVRGVYEATVTLPATVMRLLVVDKENGGRSDALNAALNVAISPYFVTVDADSILDAQALKQVMRVFQEQPDVQAAGGQIGIVNSCTVEGGHIVRRALARGYLPLCQTLEYLRSFTTMRTGWSRVNGLVILSGAFMVLARDAAVRVGGFLTHRQQYRLLDEYVGRGRDTVCEDMELVVRLHRYEHEHGRRARVVHCPVPVCWTEVPSSPQALGKQRSRWHRGLIEILLYHRRMLLNPAYGTVGMVAMPYFLMFELLGPYVEAMGYLLLPLLALLGLLQLEHLLLITAVALGFGIMQSTVAVLCATWLEPVTPAGTQVRSLVGLDRWRDRLALLAACLLAEVGYRQATVWWRLRGTYEYLRGYKGWDKFERAGFKPAAVRTGCLAATMVAAGLATGALLPPRTWAATAQTLPDAAPPVPKRPGHTLVERELSLIGGSEHRSNVDTGWWMEASSRWKWDDGQMRWLGLTRVQRRGISDQGLAGGMLLKPWRRTGCAFELRAAPGAEISPRWFLSGEVEAAFHQRITSSTVLRASRYRDVTVLDAATGTVIYLRSERWAAWRVHLVGTWFDAGGQDALVGFSSACSTPVRSAELRLQASYGGESYQAGYQLQTRELRAWSVGGLVRHPVGEHWTAELGGAYRRPDTGAAEVYLSAGARRRW